MKNNSLKPWVRMLLLGCSVSLVIVLFVPMWYIDLDAPQYPEGLRLLIYPHKIAGSVDIINGLNHYIGMKTIHTEDFIEFKLLPYIIGVFSGLFLLVTILNRVKWMNVLFVVFVLFGMVAMVDFYMWEYNYGHNLDPNAAIIVPGMAYQPPLIGFKQLLNFGAYSMPDIGGWIFVGVGAFLLFAVFKSNNFRKNKQVTAVLLTLLSTIGLSACQKNIEPIKYGVDNCKSCKMTISDSRYGALILTKKGRTYKFDEMACLLASLKEEKFSLSEIEDIYFTDFTGEHKILPKSKMLFLKSSELKSPMGGNVICFSNTDSLNRYQAKLNGDVVLWAELLK